MTPEVDVFTLGNTLLGNIDKSEQIKEGYQTISRQKIPFFHTVTAIKQTCSESLEIQCS